MVVAPKTVADKVLAGMNQYEQAAVNFIKSDQKFMGNDVSVFTCMTGNMSSWEWNWDTKKEAKKAGVDPEDAQYPEEVWRDFRNRLKQETKDIISHEEGC